MPLPLIKVHAFGTRLTVFAFAIVCIFFFKLWQPKRQIELHQKNLLTAVENHQWSRLEGQLSSKYHDHFGHDRASAIADLRQVMQSFYVATIRSQGTIWEIQSARASLRTNLTLSGNGPGAVEMISGKVNQLTDPWVFTWQKESFWPWDWKLISAENPGLNFASEL